MKDILSGAFTVLTGLALAIFILTIGPIFSIMALNTLFGLTIPLNIWTWLSAFWLTFLFASQKKISKS